MTVHRLSLFATAAVALTLSSAPVRAQDAAPATPAEAAAPAQEPAAETPAAPARRNPLAGLRAAAAGAGNAVRGAGRRVAGAARNVTSGLPNGAFSVTGREGSMLETVDPTQIQTRIVQQNAMGLASEGNNTASFDGLRLRMPETERALTEMVTRLDAHWPHERSTPFRVHVVASNEYGPETLPDGSIMVKMGLLNRAETDDEVALMLGHELSHIRLGHFADDGGFRRKRQLATMVGQLYYSAVALSEIRARESGEQVRFFLEDEARVREQRDQAAEARTMINELMTLFLERPWARKQEDEADALGFDLVVKADMAAAGAADAMFRKIDADYDARKAATENLTSGLRHTVQLAFTEQNANAVTSGQGGTVWDALSGPIQRIARDKILQMARDYFGQRHRSPEARLEGIRAYSEAAHPDMPLLDARSVWLNSVRASAEYRDATLVVDSLRNAGTLEQAGDVDGAIAAMAPALANRRFRNAPVVANTVAALHGRNRNVNEADRLYTLAHRSEDQAHSAFVEHAWLLVSNRRYSRAKEVIALGTTRAGEGVNGEKPFLPSLVAMAFQQNKGEEGMTLLQRCLAFEEKALSEKCIHAALGLSLLDRNQQIDPDTQARINSMMRQVESNSSVGGDIDALGAGLRSLFN